MEPLTTGSYPAQAAMATRPPATGSSRGLAGQHATYVVHQLEAIQTQTRKAPVMFGIVHDLTPQEIRQVAAYVQSL